MPYNTASTYTGVPVPQSVAGMIYSLEQLPHERAQMTVRNSLGAVALAW
jgi:hypothetical protein